MNQRNKPGQTPLLEMPDSGDDSGAADSRPRRPYRRIYQLSTGLGAGNIGDDLMARAFWSDFPKDLELDVAVFPTHVLQRERYPECYRYFVVDGKKSDSEAAGNAPGLLVGATIVTETEGLSWPLQFIGDRINYFHQRQLPVDAVGVGVDYLHSKRARQLFTSAFSDVRSWTVRSHHCRDALLDLNVPADKILLGADWSWLYKPNRDLRNWGAELWASLGVDPDKPLLAANVVNLVWRSHTGPKEQLARALDTLQQDHGFQIAFFCNECREGEMFDHSAALAVQALMKQPATIVPNFYWSPDEVLGLLSHVDIAISQRYHFTILPVLAGTVPVSIMRGRKMRGLAEDLGLEASCTIGNVDADRILHSVLDVCRNRKAYLSKLAMARAHLTARAVNNLAFFRLLNQPR
ncbi:MAG TPA: polysaccharide pyruvyl transferase family protein [Bryobacteraceae bacterium]|nr:polysaccharide pyruvyl transferase family protein [Bryobacteraceae bacterium]